MKNQVQLITYVDRLSGGGFSALRALLEGPLHGIFGGVHALPFFTPIDGVDAGFDPIDHTAVDPRLGTWADVLRLGESAEIMADLIVNHVSSRSPQFLDFINRGDESPYAGMFLTYGRVFPNGAPESELLEIYRPRPGLQFTRIRCASGGSRLFWTTFTSDQIDIDVLDARGQEYLRTILRQFQAAGVKAIRLDAIGYAIKKPGTSCFMIPETFDYISRLTEEAHSLGLEVLVEIHSYYKDQIDIARHVDCVYDFALPPLVLHSIFERDSTALKAWLQISPRNAVTVLDTHDGIGVIDVGADPKDPDSRPGLLTPEQIDSLVEDIHRRSQNESRMASGAAANNLDLYQVNCTFYDALGQDTNEYLIARALQFFSPGIPQVYYVGFLGGVNDMELLARSGVGRDINRHYYTRDEVDTALHQPVVGSLVNLIKFRNTHRAFAGEFQVLHSPAHQVSLEWRKDENLARLDVDLSEMSGAVTYSASQGARRLPISAIGLEGGSL